MKYKKLQNDILTSTSEDLMSNGTRNKFIHLLNSQY